jgi:hypothetical protein
LWPRRRAATTNAGALTVREDDRVFGSPKVSPSRVAW